MVRRIGISADDLKLFTIKPLVTCNNNLPPVFLGKTAAPVINQQLFDWIMVKPYCKDLYSLWSVADFMSYLSKLGVPYEKPFPIINWGETSFRLKNVSAGIIKRENSEKDISFHNSF